jgi:hypothetical protein
MRSPKTLALLAALLIGAGHSLVLSCAWTYWAVYNPLPGYLLRDLGLRGVAYHSVVQPADFLASILISLPFAWLLLRLRPSAHWAYLLAAVLPPVAFEYRLLLTSPGLPDQWGMFLFGLTSRVLFLPVTVLALVAWRRRFAANNSSKPTPLRGAA